MVSRRRCKEEMKMENAKKIVLLVLITCSVALQAQSLGNPSCSPGLRSCNQGPKTAYSGSLTCSCKATCLSCKAVSRTISASSTIKWGQPVSGRDCLIAVTAQARGGINPNSVWAATMIIAGATNPPPGTRSRVEDDCFLGLIDNEAPITGICV
jgi:hypothetical protein